MEFNIDKTRRRMLQAGLSIPVFGSLIAKSAHADLSTTLPLADEYLPLLERIYGKRAYSLTGSDWLTLKLPEIAENGQVVPITVAAEPYLVLSLVILVEKNDNPLTASCFLQRKTDLPLSLRIKLKKTSDVYVVADTTQGLVVGKKRVKVTIGCGEV